MSLTLERVDRTAVADLLALAGKEVGECLIEDCAGGGNNRVFRVRTGTADYAAKWYYRHPADTRDRLKAEYEFLEYARRIGCRQVPQPLAALPERGLALYEFVDGRKLVPGEIGAWHVDQAAEFVSVLNGRDRFTLGARLSDASEARFSVTGHVDTVRGRVERLAGIDGEEPEDVEARAVVTEIGRLLSHHVDEVMRSVRDRGEDASAELATTARRISPSDFGFHNVVVRPSGELCFLDFEYAGWDDPAKLVNDFFWQPAVPVPAEHYERFLDRCVRDADDAAELAARARLLRPLFGLKWCCIVLNEFLPVSAQRRRFAGLGTDQTARKRAQLAKARHLIESLSH